MVYIRLQKILGCDRQVCVCRMVHLHTSIAKLVESRNSRHGAESGKKRKQSWSLERRVGTTDTTRESLLSTYLSALQYNRHTLALCT